MGPLDKYILSDDALKATENGFELSFQTHWYRSLPLSCMDFNLIIDGKVIDKKIIIVKVNDKSFKYEELPNLDNEWLFVLDKGILQFESGDALIKDKLYGVEFKYDLYIPYILVGPQANPLLASSVIHKKLICQ
jgi:Domain of unknown function (DUF6379)